jgi:hypothetical protein
MFEHLPSITEENFSLIKERELDAIHGLITRCVEKTETLREAIDCVFEELGYDDPWLVKGVKSASYYVAEMLKGKVKPGMEHLAGMSTLTSVLVILRLVDLALEARGTEQRQGI